MVISDGQITWLELLFFAITFPGVAGGLIWIWFVHSELMLLHSERVNGRTALLMASHLRSAILCTLGMALFLYVAVLALLGWQENPLADGVQGWANARIRSDAALAFESSTLCWSWAIVGGLWDLIRLRRLGREYLSHQRRFDRIETDADKEKG